MQKNDKERDEHVRPNKSGSRFREAFSIAILCIILGLGLLAFAAHMYDVLAAVKHRILGW
jgi:hypothetical protein